MSPFNSFQTSSTSLHKPKIVTVIVEGDGTESTGAGRRRYGGRGDEDGKAQEDFKDYAGCGFQKEMLQVTWRQKAEIRMWYREERVRMYDPGAQAGRIHYSLHRSGATIRMCRGSE